MEQLDAMPSKALAHWQATSRLKLDEFENAHISVSGGGGRGRRYATEQLNHAYLVGVAAQFQRFCRDLHSEASQHLAAVVAMNRDVQTIFLSALTTGRKLDAGNAHPSSLGSDFKRLGIRLNEELHAASRLNRRRLLRLEQLNVWRNAIAHQDFNFSIEEQNLIRGTQPQLRFVRTWRHGCNELAEQLDSVVGAYVSRVVGTPPW